MEKVNFKSTEQDHYGMDIIPCYITQLEENREGEIFARFEIEYSLFEENQEKKKHFHAWGKLKYYDAFFVLQGFGCIHNVKLKVVTKLKHSARNYELALKASAFFNKECNCGTYLRHVAYDNRSFWEPFEGKIKFDKVPTETLVDYVKNYID